MMIPGKYDHLRAQSGYCVDADTGCSVNIIQCFDDTALVEIAIDKKPVTRTNLLGLLERHPRADSLRSLAHEILRIHLLAETDARFVFGETYAHPQTETVDYSYVEMAAR